MARIVRIHASKQPRRPHYIEAWAERRNMKPVDLARELGADKSLISRWYDGASPGVIWQERLAALFHCEPEALFRHPDDDWIRRFFEGRSKDEVDHIKRSLETTFPRKTNSSR